MIDNILKENYTYQLTNSVLGNFLKISGIPEDELNTILSLDIKECEKVDNSTLRISIETFRDEKILLKKTIEDFFKEYPSYYKLEKEKNKIFILSEKKFHTQINNLQFNNYANLKNLDLLFNKISIDKKDTENHTITYEVVHKRKLNISNKFDTSKLVSIDRKISFLFKKTYKKICTENELDIDMKIVFLKKTIEDFFNDKKNITFNDIVNNFEELMAQYEIILRAYVEELDTEKIKYDYEKKIQELNEKLSNMTNDINTKILILPIAYVLGAAQIKKDTDCIIIGLIFLGLIAFTTLVTIFSNIQKELMESINIDITYWENFYKKNLKTTYNTSIKYRFSKINKLVLSLKSRIFLTLFISWGLIVIFGVCIIFIFQKTP